MGRISTRVLWLLISLIILGVILVESQIIYGHNTNNGNKIAVVFRYDDCSGMSSTNLESKLINTLRRHRIPCIFGVVPRMCARNREDPSPQESVGLSRAKIRMLKEAVDKKYIEVALHGYSHHTIVRRQDRLDSEFAGLTFDKQFKKISAGKRILEKELGVSMDTFIPPWNSYDLNTLRVLEAMHFSSISADKLGAVRNNSLKYMPMTCKLSQLREAIAQARRNKGDRPVITVLFHPFDFREGDSQRYITTINQLDKLLDWLNSQRDVAAVTGEYAERMTGDFTPQRQNEYARLYYMSQSQLLPTFLKRSYYYYPASVSLRRVAIEHQLLIAMIYAGVMAIAIGAVSAAGMIRDFWGRISGTHIKRAGLAVLGCLFIYELSCGNIWFRPAVVIVGIIGIYIGTLIVPWKRRLD